MNPFVTTQVDLSLGIGISLQFVVNVLDSNSAAVDLTGCTARLKILQDDVVVLSIQTPDGTNQITLTENPGAVAVDLLPATSGTWFGTYEARLEIDFPNGHNARLFKGIWTYS